VGDNCASTEWGVILAAGGADADALAQFCGSYWTPVYWLVRREVGNTDQAKDLTQEFFTHLIEKRWLHVAVPERGRFRSFLYACVKHFLANERHRARALKRGGGTTTVTLDRMDEDSRPGFEPLDLATPASEFEQRWALTVLERAMKRLQRIETSTGRGHRFEVLQPALTGDQPSGGYRQLATRLETTEGALKVELHRLRRRFGAALRDEVGATLSDPSQIDAELRYLLTVLRRR
jgi:RNA polymerase sigma factor (sigma-70 family)